MCCGSVIPSLQTVAELAEAIPQQPKPDRGRGKAGGPGVRVAHVQPGIGATAQGQRPAGPPLHPTPRHLAGEPGESETPIAWCVFILERLHATYTVRILAKVVYRVVCNRSRYIGLLSGFMNHNIRIYMDRTLATNTRHFCVGVCGCGCEREWFYMVCQQLLLVCRWCVMVHKQFRSYQNCWANNAICVGLSLTVQL